jgi:hypothetical protein
MQTQNLLSDPRTKNITAYIDSCKPGWPVAKDPASFDLNVVHSGLVTTISALSPNLRYGRN